MGLIKKIYTLEAAAAAVVMAMAANIQHEKMLNTL